MKLDILVCETGTLHDKFPMYDNDSSESDCDVCFDMDGKFLPKHSTDKGIRLLVRQTPK